MFDFSPVLLPHPAQPIRVGVHNFYEELTRDGYMLKNPNASIGHMLLKPWCDLYAFGKTIGVEFFTLDQVSGPEALDVVIFLDRPSPQSALANRFLASTLLKYLIVYECPVIKPDNWERSFQQQFDRVFTWNDMLLDGVRYLKSNFPFDPETYAFDLALTHQRYAERKLCTLIAGAKAVSHPNELYSHRIRTIRWFEAEAPQDFDLYGMGWQAAAFPSYRGSVDDKLQTLADYRFSICYENAQGYPGYITEKILDCLLAGCVPLYGGAPNITEWIPEDCFIHVSRFSSYPEMYAFIKNMSEESYRGYLERIDNFLHSPKAFPFTTKAFVDTLLSCLARDVRFARGELTLPLLIQKRDLHLALFER